jgi:hypothetical protein
MFDATIAGKVLQAPDLTPSKQTGIDQIRVVIRVNQSRGQAVPVVAFSQDRKVIRQLAGLTVGQRIDLTGELTLEIWHDKKTNKYLPSASLWIESVD